MLNAMWVALAALVAFLSCYLMLKGWSLIGGRALSHSIVPGVAGAYMIGLLSFGAFLSGGLAAAGMLFLSQQSKLKEDAIIGLIFTSFFGLGLSLVSLFPTSVNIQTIVMGNILAITPTDTLQIVLIGCTSLLLLIIKWRDFMVVFFDENHAKTIGLSPNLLKVLFFSILSACTVAALQTVGAFLVIAMVVIPGATAYLLSDRFSTIIILSVFIGVISALLGAYLSYFINGATGGIIVLLQTVFFIFAFHLAPNYGKLATYKKAKQALNNHPFSSSNKE